MAPNPVIWPSLMASSSHSLLGEGVGRANAGGELCHARLRLWQVVELGEEKQSEGSNEEERDHENPGIELGDGIYEFVAGDKSHEEHSKIYEMVEEMEKKMIREVGYVSTMSNVLLDIEEEDKEGALNKHSEKLAIAFALLKTSPRSTIRIVKNLRVCGDCHSATKLMSLVYDREIVVRDRNRFHHFKDGLCSCKDFW